MKEQISEIITKLTKINNVSDLETIKEYCNKEIKLLKDHYIEHQNLSL